ncbi:hypothetical protein Tco_1452136 [Tanacetum coccineum]
MILGTCAKGDIGYFISYFSTSCAYRVYNRRTKKVMETMNVTVDELSTIAFEQRSLKLELQGRTSGHISLGLDLTYASSTITSQKPTERDLELLFETMYDDYMGGQLLDATRTAPAAPATMNLQSLNASTTTAENVLIPTNSSIEAPAIPKTSHDDNAHDGMFDKDMFIHPFAQPSTSSAKSSLQYVDPSNMHTTMEPRNVKEAMTDARWIEAMQDELLISNGLIYGN